MMLTHQAAPAAAARYSCSPAAAMAAAKSCSGSGHGCHCRLLAGLGRCGLAAAEGEVVLAGRAIIGIFSMVRIT
jgi:hypothetical protein